MSWARLDIRQKIILSQSKIIVRWDNLKLFRRELMQWPASTIYNGVFTVWQSSLVTRQLNGKTNLLLHCYFLFPPFLGKNKTLLIYLLWICPQELWGGVFCVLSPRLCPSPYHTPAPGQGQQSGWAGTWRWPMGHCEAGRKGSGEWSFQWSLVKETEQVLFKILQMLIHVC